MRHACFLLIVVCFTTHLWLGHCFSSKSLHAQDIQPRTQRSVSNRESAQSNRESAQELQFFETKIRPVLVEHCYDCHSSDSAAAEAQLSLDTREGLFSGGVSGKVVIPGKPNSSLLLLAIQHEDRNLAMPPADAGGKLPASVIADFNRWITRGAFYPLDSDSRSTGTDASGQHLASDAKDWWAWQPPRLPTIPEHIDQDWGVNEIDRFVAAKLQENELTPSQPADRYTLVRRLAIDLTGLPPSSEEIASYASPESPRPLSELVDQYLASDQFGERFGRHWLDVARFAESTGKDINLAYPHAWRYRDYVIDAFCADKPIDAFIFEQIAGDLMAGESAKERGENLIATGFLAMGPKSVNEMNPLQFAVDVADEQIDALSQAFLGVTIACARCHDHKFDPVTQADYTAMAGIMLSTQTHFGTTGGVAGRNLSTLLELPEQFAVDAASRNSLSPEEVERLRERIAELEGQRRELALSRRRGEADQTERLKFLRITQQLNRLNVELESVDSQGRKLPQTMGVSEKPPAPTSSVRGGRWREARRIMREAILAGQMPENPAFSRGRQVLQLQYIADSPQLVRGEIDKPGEPIPRGLPEFLASGQSVSIPNEESGRRQLAAWLTSDQNPLTARVFVNRVWCWLLGQGIVKSGDNFGTSGEIPSHPELLDYLALDFTRNNWSVKTLVRKIVLSQTYQQSSDLRQSGFSIDPANQWLWRANRKPLDAESLRDGMLMVSESLEMERPQGSLVSENGDGPIGGRRFGVLSEDEITQLETNARSIYLPVPRNVLPQALELFDFADNSAVLGQRELTIVPSQALYWMNSDSVEHYCQQIAQSLLRDASPRRPARWNLAFQRRRQRFAPRGWPRNPNLVSEPPNSAEAQIQSMLNQLTLQILSRPPLDAESVAVEAYVKQQQNQGRTQDAIWTAVVRSLFSSADYRFLR